jgi:inner membrane protein
MLAGAVAAVLPDVDRLIHSASDPLLHIEYHRHFTHALAFVPIGGIAATLLWVAFPSRRQRWLTYLLACTAAYATHGLLDATTSYGTLLLWPFSFERVAWNWISIVDPAFTLILLAGVALSAWQTRERAVSQSGGAVPVAVATVLCCAYLGMGAGQRERALDALHVIAAGRGHEPVRAEIFPGFLNHLVWRSLYEDGGTLYMDRIHVPWVGKATWSPGPSIAAFTAGDLPARVSGDARLRADFGRFRWFSGGWVARHPADPAFIGDARYSLEPDRFEPVWGVRFRPDDVPPVEWVDRSRGRRISVPDLWTEVVGRDPRYRRLPNLDP